MAVASEPQTAFAVERFVCQRRDCNGGSCSECIAIWFCDAEAECRLRFSAKIAIDFNPSLAVHRRANLLAVTDLESLGMCQSADTHSAPAGTTVMSRRGTTATGVRTCQATRLGPSLTVPSSDGKLVLGTWQQIFHLKYDVRGREHTTAVTVIGDERQSTRE